LRNASLLGPLQPITNLPRPSCQPFCLLGQLREFPFEFGQVVF